MLSSRALAGTLVHFGPDVVGAGARPSQVNELPRGYEDEGSIRQAMGSLSLEGAAWWSASLSVPTSGDDLATVRLARHGVVPRGVGVGVDVTMQVPASELEAIIALLVGVVAQARRDAVLP